MPGLLLDLVYGLALLVLSPWLVFKSWRTGKYREGAREKLLGKAPRRLGDRPCVWFHAVSVGEVLLLRPLIAEIARRRPDWDTVVSTTTIGGLTVARQTCPELVTFYAPLDFSWAVRRAVARVRPTVLALVELELWPQLVRAASESGAKVAIVNGRLSERSHRGYRRVRALLRPTLSRIDLVAAQSPEHAARFADLGIAGPRVATTGSMKYDGLETERGNPRSRMVRAELGIASSDIVFVAGSTMAGEEEAALRAFREARVKHPGLRLVLVPRHPHRFDEVAAWLDSIGQPYQRRSRGPVVAEGAPVLLVDTLGELGAVWGLADVAFVGGSLFPGRGGQNMMEPAAFGASVIFGRHTQNFRATVDLLLSANAARVVAGPRELADALLADLDDPERAAARGEAARELVKSQHGATDRTFRLLDHLMAPPLERTPRSATRARRTVPLAS